MARLNTAKNIASPDDVYEMLIDLHRDCDEPESHRRNAKLILALANHVGDPEIIAEAVALARRSA